MFAQDGAHPQGKRSRKNTGRIGNEASPKYLEIKKQLNEEIQEELEKCKKKAALPKHEKRKLRIVALKTIIEGTMANMSPMVQEHIRITLSYIDQAPTNLRNHNLPNKSWLYNNQEKFSLKGDVHLKKYGFEQTFHKRGLSAKAFLRDLAAVDGGLEKDLHDHLVAKDEDAKTLHGTGNILNR